MKTVLLTIFILACGIVSGLYALDVSMENLILDGDWDAVYTQLRTDSTINSDPVVMILYNQACLATNRIQKYHKFSPEDYLVWAEYCGKLRKKYPGNAIAVYLFGDAKLRFKQYDEAIIEFTEALGIDDKLGLAYAGRGLALSSKNESDLAIKEYNSAINGNDEISEYYYLRALEYHKQGKYNDAISDCSKAIQIQPDHARAYSQRGQSYHRREKYDEAIFDYNDALDLNPNLVYTYYLRGKAFFETRQHLEAIADYLIYLQQEPNNLDAHIDVANAFRETGKFEQAIEHLDRAIRIDPTISYVYLLKSQICEDCGKFLDAIAACRSYIKYAPSNEAEQIDQTFIRIEDLKRKLDESEL